MYTRFIFFALSWKCPCKCILAARVNTQKADTILPRQDNGIFRNFHFRAVHFSIVTIVMPQRDFQPLCSLFEGANTLSQHQDRIFRHWLLKSNRCIGQSKRHNQALKAKGNGHYSPNVKVIKRNLPSGSNGHFHFMSPNKGQEKNVLLQKQQGMQIHFLWLA